VESSNSRKFTILSFFLLSALGAYLFFRGLTQLLDWFKLTNMVTAAVGGYPWKVVGGVISGAVGLVTFVGLSVNQKATSFSDEVFTEAKKVTWPTGKETYASTLVVVIMVVSAGILLFVLDSIWNWIFRAILS